MDNLDLHQCIICKDIIHGLNEYLTHRGTCKPVTSTGIFFVAYPSNISVLLTLFLINTDNVNVLSRLERTSDVPPAEYTGGKWKPGHAPPNLYNRMLLPELDSDEIAFSPSPQSSIGDAEEVNRCDSPQQVEEALIHTHQRRDSSSSVDLTDTSNPLIMKYCAMRRMLNGEATNLDNTSSNNQLLRLEMDIAQTFPFICEICRFYASSMSCFTWHLNSPDHISNVNAHKHHSIKFKCQICGSTLASIESLIRHFNVERKKCNSKNSFSSHLLRGTIFTCTRIITYFKCIKCKLTFNSRIAKAKHAERIHAIHAASKKRKSESPKPVTSTDTILPFKSNQDQLSANHCQEACDKLGHSLSCPVCGSLQSNKSNLKQHMTRHVPYLQRKFECDVCSLRFAVRADLNKHVKTHSDVKSFSCMQCTYTGKSLQALKKHRKVHLPVDPLKCSKCSFSCKLLCNLRRHERTHLQLEPTYTCPYCPYGTLNQENLRKHILTSKKHQGLHMYLCQCCNFSTNSHAEYRKHISSLHPEKSMLLKSAVKCK